MFLRSPRFDVTALIGLLLLVGCGRPQNPSQQITTYDVTKESPSSPAPLATPDGEPDEESVGAWALGEAWDNPRVVMETAGSPVTSIVFWPDGSRFATSSGAFDRHIEVWSFPNFQRLDAYETERTNKVRIDQIALSPDTDTLAAAAGDVVKLFDTATGTVRQVLDGHSGRVTGIVYTADGRHLVSCSADETIRVWTADGTLHRTIEGHGGEIYVVAVSPDGKWIASGGVNEAKAVKLWNLETGEEFASLDEQASLTTALAFSPDGKYLATAASLRTSLFLWDVQSKSKVGTWTGHAKDVSALAFSRDGKLLLSGSNDCTIRVWDVAIGESGPPLWGHRGRLSSITFTPDGTEFLSADDGGNLLRWNVEEAQQHPERFRTTGEETDSLFAHREGSLTSIALTPDGKTLFAHASGSPVCLWDVPSRTLRHEIRHFSGSALPCTASHDGTMVAYGEGYERVRVIDSQSAEEVFRTEGLDGFVVELAFLPDDKTLIVAAGKRVYGLKVPSGEEAFSWDAEKQELGAMAVLPKNDLLVTGGDEKLLKYWSLTTKTLVKSIPGHQDKILGVYATSDEKKLVTMDIWNDVRVWDRQQGRQIRRFDPDHPRVDVMLIAPDDRTVVFPSGQIIVVWDLETGKIRKQLLGHLDDVWGLALTPDGKTLISSASDGTIKFWDFPP